MARACAAFLAAAVLIKGAAGFAPVMTGDAATSGISRRTLLGTGVAISSGLLSLPSQSPAAPVQLPEDAYTLLGGELPCCRILNGMWQLSGAHGFTPQLDPALGAMQNLASAGFTTFDLADHYGPAEFFVGEYRERNGDRAVANQQFFTKWVPRPTKMPRDLVDAAIGRSLDRMHTKRLDLLQFHWWDYDSLYYMDALHHMQDMVAEGSIRHLGLTNFDTRRLQLITDKGINIVSNQVQYSMLDTRPAARMQDLCTERSIQLLCYGTLLGGFLSDKWVGKLAPAKAQFETVSQQKYYNMIRAWGGWDLFQQLLSTCKKVADKHGVSVANVGVRWVLQQPAVGGAIVGARLGLTDHIADSARVFSFKLDADDEAAIAEVQAKSRNLMTVIGDCGDEYRA
eukprot:TRINITY_DN5647_c0_g1_i1.p1 TRINITY_DN5647_c0_g1~~TRINITY_DN5647_c0_g1_i1.p1  ORF type:complete len:398 (-),score=103.28 TRINITY_DN5647_c0_g1_i1:212-1405(-)